MQRRKQFYCPECEKNVLAIATDDVNHVAHALLTLVTLGLWIVVWLILALCDSGKRVFQCPWCGEIVKSPAQK